MGERTIRVKCIVCPLGCEITVTLRDNEILSIEGHSCSRGEKYAREEVLEPKRVLMTVVKVKGGDLPVVSVKSEKPIPKQLIFEAIRELSKVEVDAPVRIGDVIIENLLGLNVRVIATRNVEKVSES